MSRPGQGMGDDPADIARELEGFLKSGGLDPGALIAGEWSFHSAFLAPFTPTFAAARETFLRDGSGPLAATVGQLQGQGLAPAEAAATARQMLESAQGLLVAVVAGDHGVSTLPQPFFGHLDPGWRDGASRVLGPQFQAPFVAALESLAQRSSAAWPDTVAGPALAGDLAAYWLELAHGCASAVESTGPQAQVDGRTADLALWVVSAIGALRPELDGDDHVALVRCAIAAGRLEGACAGIAACAAAGGEDAVIELLDTLAVATCRCGGDPAVEAWLGGEGMALAAGLGCAYDGALARLRVVAAAGAGEDRLRPAVDALFTANRKLARQALTREPIWQVTVADPGELVDTATAADLLGRSTTFVSKRLEARTIPLYARDGQVRLPRRTLLAWKSALDAHHALD